jgi:hypothetical protein
MSEPTATHSTSEQAFRNFLETLSEAADTITGPLGAKNERERAEGFRHLTRLVSVWLENILERGSREHPSFTRWINPTRKLLGDNPHTYYDAALIDSHLSYRIVGHRGSPTYLGFCIYGTAENGDRRISGNLDDSEMEFGADGRFELHLSKERPAGVTNWIALEPDSSDVMVRQYFLDPENQENATYLIEATPAPPSPAPLTEEEFAYRLATVGRFVQETLQVETTISALAAQSTPHFLRHGESYEKKEDEGEGAPIDFKWVAKAMPTPAILYTGNWVDELGDDEVMIVEGRPPTARYWSVQILNRWMESPDFRYHEVFYTSANIALESDGSFRIAIAHRDPGLPNWLDTTGIRSFNITVRAVKAQDESLDVSFRREKLRVPQAGCEHLT